MRRTVLLAGGVLLAGAGLFMSTGAGPAPAASIEGAPLAPSTPTPAEVATFENLANQPAKTPRTEPKADTVDKAAAKIAKSIAASSVDLDLDKLQLVGDHYETSLRDGRTARLTLDPELQKLAEKLLDQSRAPRGAIVAMAPDGRLLAFAGRRTEADKGGTDGKRDFSLVTNVWAPAASVFKLVTASALLANGYNADAKVCFHGGVRSVMESNLIDSKLDGRCETLEFGVAHSNNAILGKLAYQNLEPNLLDRQARDLGLANALPASFGVRASCGEIDLPKAKDLAFAKSAAGFAGSRLSVLGGAVLAGTFADDGEQPTPYLIESIDGTNVTPPKTHRVLTKAVAERVTKMMVETCDSGSASRTFRKHKTVAVAGKTGTLAQKTPFYMEHSWFVGFAPANAPQVVVSVLLGNPVSWHLRGHEAAKFMIDRAIQRAEDRAKH